MANDADSANRVLKMDTNTESANDAEKPNMGRTNALIALKNPGITTNQSHERGMKLRLLKTIGAIGSMGFCMEFPYSWRHKRSGDALKKLQWQPI